MDRQWRIRVDVGACQQAGQCAGIAPRHFNLQPGQRSTPRSTLIEPDQDVLLAAYCCPTEAIEVVDAHTGEAIEQ